MQTQKNNQLYFPLLDTTRFIAFIPVFLTHCFITSNQALQEAFWFKKTTLFLDVGLLGLDYFFVLSSFLITRLIIDERQQFKSFSFNLFFVRRCLRIWPLYFLMVFIGFACSAAGMLHAPLPPLLNFVSFTLNFYIAENGYQFLFFLVFLWSISVEEQFYIFWGLWLNFTSKISAQLFQYSIPVVAISLIFISLIFRYHYSNQELKLYFHTLSVAANFGIGILLAYMSAYTTWLLPLLKKTSKLTFTLLLIILLLSMFSYSIVFTLPITILFERLYFSFLFALIIAVLCYSSFTVQLIPLFKRFDYLGKISLGLYFYHGIVITVFSKAMIAYPIANHTWQVMLINPLIMLTLSIICASISYNYFEKPILAFKNKFYRPISTKV